MAPLSNLKFVLRAYGEGNIFGEPYGGGPVQVVWLHGWARTGQDFAPAARELAESGVSSVALDLPGFGSSPSPTVAGGARAYAELVVPVLRQIAQAPLVLVGHSLGGRIATVVAANNPELLRSVVLVSVPFFRRSGSTKSPWRYRLVRWLHAKSFVSEDRMEAARQRYGSLDYRRASGIMRDVLVATVNESYEDELARCSVPVRMLWGSSDTDTPVATAIRAGETLKGPNALHVLEGVGHLVPSEAPGALVAAVREALA